jgi:ABC-2 type transport system ATP-binding protein
LQEASAVADRLVIIDRGKLVANGTLKELKDQKGKDVMFAVTVQAPKDDVWAALKSIPTVKELKLAGESASSFRFIGTAGSLDEVAAFVNQFVKQKGWILKELALREPSLEDVFLGYFKPVET